LGGSRFELGPAVTSEAHSAGTGPAGHTSKQVVPGSPRCAERCPAPAV